MSEATPAWVKIGFTELRNPHREKARTYAHPAFGPDTYQNVGAKILSAGLVVPTGEDAAELIHDTYCNPETQGLSHYNGKEGVRGVVQNRWLWVFNSNLWTPQGMFSLKDRNAQGRSRPLELKALERMLKGGTDIKGTNVRVSNDGELRFAPLDSYTFGEHTPEELALDGAMIAQYGKEGASMLAEASSKLPNKPKTYGITVSQGSEQRVSTLNEYCSRLRFGGDGFGGGVVGYAFGLRAPAEGRA